MDLSLSLSYHIYNFRASAIEHISDVNTNIPKEDQHNPRTHKLEKYLKRYSTKKLEKCQVQPMDRFNNVLVVNVCVCLYVSLTWVS